MKRLIKIGLITTILGAVLLWQGPNLAFAAKCYSLSPANGFVCESDPPEPTFVKPDPFADSFLPYVTYAKLADLANVYASPSYGSEIVRNVGDGFLFSTIQGVVEAEDGLWYAINHGEYVHENDLRLVDDSEFYWV